MASSKEYMIEWHANNVEHEKAWRKDYYANNLEEAKRKNAEQYQKNKERILAERRTPEYRELRAARKRARYKTDPVEREKAKRLSNVRRFKILPEELEEFKAMYGQDCFYCGKEDSNTVDHLTPRSRGGEDRLYNLVPCCMSCNSSKGNRTPEEWYASDKQSKRSEV